VRGSCVATLAAALFLAASTGAYGRIASDRGVDASTLAVIVNDADPLSTRIAAYYRERRGVPAGNVIHVRFDAGSVALTRNEFARIKAEADAGTPDGVQAYLLTWAQPYRVACMSITTAFAAGFDPAFCGGKQCSATKRLPYFDSSSERPYDDYGIRPTMMLAATDLDRAKALIDRGVASDGTRPAGTAYLVRTQDPRRNVRAAAFPALAAMQETAMRVEYVEADHIEGRDDVMFYFTGTKAVAALETNRFRPGAVADHLTSGGGKLTDARQMSSLRWLEAGATGSYGTVTEPCAIADKFPAPAIVLRRYLAGETLLEAYWKSVATPGQGVFIGEPLARPFGGR
jgi:uncharacterized protein (TIGR03790 family)